MRFSNTVSWLVSNKKAQDKKEIAAILGISTSLMTEISKERSNVGVIPLQNIVIKYGISGDWLLTGEGTMLKTDTPDDGTKTEEETASDGVTAALERIIQRQAKEIARLEIELEKYRQDGSGQ